MNTTVLKILAHFLLAILLTFLIPGLVPAQQRHVVVFEAALPGDAAALVEAAGGQIAGAFAEAGVAIATSSRASFAADLEAVAEVEACGLLTPRPAHEVFATANDTTAPVYPAQWNLQRIGTEAAWRATRGSHDTVIAVIDTGIAANHPELGPNLVESTCFAALGVCQDYPVLDHGNHMAGIIAAAGQAIAGIGPELGLASLNVVEFLDLDGDGVPETPVVLDDAIWEALLYAAERGFEVVNMSFAAILDPRDPDQRALLLAWRRILARVERHGLTLVASAGNDGARIDEPLVVVPAGLERVIAVAATALRPLPVWPQPGGFDVRAFYSNTGSFLSLAAPGGDCGHDRGFDPCDPEYLLLSTGIDFNTDPSCVARRDCAPLHVVSGGTSGAAATVAAAAGLVIDAWDGVRSPAPSVVEKILLQTAMPIGGDDEFGAGLLDLEAAVSRAATVAVASGHPRP